MGKAYEHSNGSWGLCPETRDQAIKLKVHKYGGVITCEDCGKKSSRYVTTNNCTMCQRIKLELARHSYLYDEFVPYPENAPLPIRKVDWSKEVQEIIKLLTEGEVSFAQNPCKKYGHVGLLNSSRNCHFCHDLPSPLKQAVKEGKEWYIPAKFCKGCGFMAERHVKTSECKGCGYLPPSKGVHKSSEPDARETADSLMMRDNPDMIIDRKTAREFEFKVYRTGGECKRGHSGWRYVKTGNCIQCLRGV